MALRLRSSKDVKKSSYYVWYLGAREAKGVDAMPGAIAYLLERERLQEPFKVTLQVRDPKRKTLLGYYYFCVSGDAAGAGTVEEPVFLLLCLFTPKQDNFKLVY